MTTKEKEKQVVSEANQLISLHSLTMLSEIGNKLTISEVKQIAKQCALITVDEILNNFGLRVDGKPNYTDSATIQFYQEVKQEIENYE